VAEIVCGDSTTIAKAMDSKKVFGWGRGYSTERKLDISRFKPKELSFVQTQHRFLIPIAGAELDERPCNSENSRESILSKLQIDLP